jgi:hypothetical protein
MELGRTLQSVVGRGVGRQGVDHVAVGIVLEDIVPLSLKKKIILFLKIMLFNFLYKLHSYYSYAKSSQGQRLTWSSSIVSCCSSNLLRRRVLYVLYMYILYLK